MATITFGLMNPPLESENICTAFRFIDAAIRKGHNVNVFAYEGAVGLTSMGLARHADPLVTGASVEEMDHPTTREWVESLQVLARSKGVTLTWTNCGLCIEERGLGAQLDGTTLGTPKDLLELADASDGFLFIATK